MIDKVRIRNIDSYLIGIHDNDNFLYQKASEINADKLNLLGFSIPLISGEQILPRALGAVSRLNANGSFIKRRELTYGNQI